MMDVKPCQLGSTDRNQADTRSFLGTYEIRVPETQMSGERMNKQ